MKSELSEVDLACNTKTNHSDELNTKVMTSGGGRDYFHPFSIVWTPIPVLSWLFPIIGHMGITTSTGAIRDFAGPYHVAECDMAFGKPVKYVNMRPDLARGGSDGWDQGVHEASEIYKQKMHNLFCDNCHSMVATALDKMNYNNSSSWNMVKLAFMLLWRGKYVSFQGWLITWLPFLLIVSSIVLIIVFV